MGDGQFDAHRIGPRRNDQDCWLSGRDVDCGTVRGSDQPGLGFFVRNDDSQLIRAGGNLPFARKDRRRTGGFNPGRFQHTGRANRVLQHDALAVHIQAFVVCDVTRQGTVGGPGPRVGKAAGTCATRLPRS